MKKFDVPLKIVENSSDTHKIIRAKRIIDSLNDEELDQCIDKTSFAHLQSINKLETLFTELQEDKANADKLNEKISKRPKNYDIALSLSTRNQFDAAHRLMQKLVQNGKTKEPLENSLIN